MGQFKTYKDSLAESKLIRLEADLREIKAIQSYSTGHAVMFTSNSLTNNARSVATSYGTLMYYFGAYYEFTNDNGRTVIPRILCNYTGQYTYLSTSNPAGVASGNKTLFLVKSWGTEPYSVTAKIIANDSGILTLKQELTDAGEFYEYL